MASSVAPAGGAKAQSSSRLGKLTGLTRDGLVAAYRSMLLSRAIDDREIHLRNQSQVFFQISGAGHEAILTAAAMAFKPGYDWFFPYYRDRALCLMLGLTPYEMFLAAVGAQDDGMSAGRQMPSHWSSRRLHIPTQSSVVASQCLHAVGCAEATVRYRALGIGPSSGEPVHPDEVTYVSVGEGGTSEGEFWEALNTACTERLPLVVLVEDNGYAISTPVLAQTPGADIGRLVEAFPGLTVLRCDGTDFAESLVTMREAVRVARAGGGPVLVHARCIRPYSHSHSDDETLYKTAAERDEESRRDPLARMARALVDDGLVDAAQLAALSAEVEQEASDAADRALAAAKPDPATALDFVFSPEVDPTSAAFSTVAAPSGKPDTLVGAINRTLKDEMTREPRIVVFGQDVADASKAEALSEVSGKGGVFKATHGLQRQFGATRVFNSPLAEANIVGRAVGLAVRGMKPVVEIQFFDYIWPAMLQIRDELSVFRYRSGNTWAAPVVIRTPIGGYLRGGGPYHSQSGASIFAHCPGIRIAFPSTAADAAGLLRTAIRCDDPVLFLEHKHLYRQTYTKGEYPGPDYMVPFGKADIRRPGTDIVILTWGALVQKSLLAAQQAEQDGLSVAVVDLRTLIPYDWDTIATMVTATNRVIIAHEDQLTCGFGAEIAARISDELFDQLDAPIRRVAALDCPVAYSPTLEEAILPGSTAILRAIKDTAAY